MIVKIPIDTFLRYFLEHARANSKHNVTLQKKIQISDVCSDKSKRCSLLRAFIDVFLVDRNEIIRRVKRYAV